MACQMWINGSYTSGSSGNIIEVHNSATEEIIDTALVANTRDVDQAIAERCLLRL